MTKLCALSTLLCIFLTACGDYNGKPGIDGQDGGSCTVVDTDAGAEIRCDDGSSVEISDGQDGTTAIIVCFKTRHGYRQCVTR